VTYSAEQRERVLAIFRQGPDRQMDGTGTWSLTTLQRAVRKQSGMSQISRDTLSGILHAAGLTWQRDRTWCETGVSVRTSKHGQQVVKKVVVDPDMEAKKS
jgi:transposase